MTSLNFAASVDSWVRQTEQRMTAVFRESAQEVIAEAQALAPVDTGFMKATAIASTAEMPLINPAAHPMHGGSYAYQPSLIALTIGSAELGQTIHFGYTASYAALQEYGTSKHAGRGFVRLAAQNWPAIVERVTATAKARAMAN